MAENRVQQVTERLIPWLGRQWERVWFWNSPLLQTMPLAPSSRPTDADPVIIVSGLADTWYGGMDFAKALRRDGFQVFLPDLPHGGSDGVDVNARYLKQYIDMVKRMTGKSRVDLIGHSQGPLTIRWYVKFLGGADSVDSVISVNSPNHGVRGWWGPKGYDAIRAIPLIGHKMSEVIGVGTRELFAGSQMLQTLNSGDETPGANVRYISMYSADHDGNVEPWSAPLAGARNIALTRDTHFLGRKRGPNHAYAFHTSFEVYDLLRAALLEPRSVADAAAGAASLPSSRRRTRRRVALIRGR